MNGQGIYDSEWEEKANMHLGGNRRPWQQGAARKEDG